MGYNQPQPSHLITLQEPGRREIRPDAQAGCYASRVRGGGLGDGAPKNVVFELEGGPRGQIICCMPLLLFLPSLSRALCEHTGESVQQALTRIEGRLGEPHFFCYPTNESVRERKKSGFFKSFLN